jgi:hypothetical protein
MRRLGRWALAVRPRGTVAETVLARARQLSRCPSCARGRGCPSFYAAHRPGDAGQRVPALLAGRVSQKSQAARDPCRAGA